MLLSLARATRPRAAAAAPSSSSSSHPRRSSSVAPRAATAQCARATAVPAHRSALSSPLSVPRRTLASSSSSAPGSGRGQQPSSQQSRAQTPSPAAAAAAAAAAPADESEPSDAEPMDLVDLGQFLKSNQPPIKVSSPAGRYARLLYVYANINEAHAQVEADLNLISQALMDVPSLREVIFNPLMKKTHRQAIIRDALTKIGVHNENVLQLAERLAIDNVTPLLPDVIDAYGEMVSSKDQTVDVTLTVALEEDVGEYLEEEENDKSVFLTAIAADLLGNPDAKINLHVNVDPSILGGCTVEAGDLFVDSSLAAAMNNFYETTTRQATSQLESLLTDLNTSNFWTTERLLGKNEAQAWKDAAKEMETIPQRYADATVEPEEPLPEQQDPEDVADQALVVGELFRQYLKTQVAVNALAGK